MRYVMDSKSVPGVLMVVWYPLQILCDTTSRSLLARAHAGTPVILLRLLEF